MVIQFQFLVPWIYLIVNSLFLLAVSELFLLSYLPIMIYIEEDDLIRRFGDAYREYQKRTGALYPKLKKTKFNLS